MPGIVKFDHFAIAVRNLDEAVHLFRDVFGASVAFTKEIPELGIRSAFCVWGDKMVTLEQPIREDSPFAEFIRKRGEGIHHIAVEVENLDDAIAELEGQGIRLINLQLTGEQRREALVLPKQFMGILLQVIEWRGACKNSLEARLEFSRTQLQIPSSSSPLTVKEGSAAK